MTDTETLLRECAEALREAKAARARPERWVELLPVVDALLARIEQRAKAAPKWERHDCPNDACWRLSDGSASVWRYLPTEPFAASVGPRFLGRFATPELAQAAAEAAAKEKK